MANVISDEILKLKIVVNGDEAQKRVLDLEKANQALGTKLKELIVQEKELDKQRKAEERILKSNTDKLAKYNEKLNKTVEATANEVAALRKKQEAYQQGTKEYDKLEKQIEKVRERADNASKAINNEIQALTDQQGQFEKNLGNATNAYNKLKREIGDTKDAIADNKGKIDEEIGSMNIMNMTLEQLTRKAEDLKNSMRHMTEGESLDKTREELQAINDRINEMRNGPDEDPDFIDQFNHYIGVIAAAIASVTGFLLKMQEVVDMNNELVDAQTNVAKTTGMTIEEVESLTAAYVDFDTRTNKMDLLKIAEVGGRLGVPKAEIQDFTREVDKAYVALGDSFSGGVEKVAEKIGKIKGLFKETKDLDFATALNQIGSGLNELGAAGAASEENMSDFALRVGQLPESLKPSIAETLALGGAFEESGINAERASSGYMNFITTAGKETDKFAKVMHLSQGEVEKMLKQDPLQFFLKFSEGAKGLDAVNLSKVLESLKLNSGEVVSIVGAASENSEKFRKSIEASNVAMTEATSLTDEFGKVNNNAAAIYDKVKKKWTDIYTSEKVAKVLAYLIDVIGKLLGVVEDTTGGITIFRNTLIFLTKLITIGAVAIFSYNAALYLTELTIDRVKAKLLSYTVIQKVNNFLNESGAFFQNLYNLAVGYGSLAIATMTRNTELQTAAQQRLNLVTKANPWAALLAIAMAVVTAYILFSEEADEAAKKQKILNDIKTKAAAATVDEKVKLENLLAVARDENQAKENRLKAIKQLNEISPQYLGNLTLENIKTAEGTKLVNEYIKALDRKAMAEVLSEKRAELYKKQLEIQSSEVDPGWQKLGGFTPWLSTIGNERKTTMSVSEAKYIDSLVKTADVEKELAKYIPIVSRAYRERRDQLRDNFNDIKTLNDEQKKFLRTDAGSFVDANSKSNYTPIPDKEKKSKKTDAEKEAERQKRAYERMRDKILEGAEEYNQKELELEADKQASLAEMQKDGYEKERNILIAERDKRLADLEGQKYKQSDFDDIDKIIAKEKGDLQQKFITIKNQWIEGNKLIEATMIAEREKTNYKLSLLEEKFTTEALRKEEEAMQERVNIITREQNKTISQNTTLSQQKEFLKSKGFSDESLRMIENWEQGKAAIEKYYQQKSLEEQVTFLQEQLTMFETVSAMAPDLLSEDQIETIQQYKDKIAALVAEITKLKKGEEQKLGGKLTSFGGDNADLLGLTQDQWKAMFTNTDNLSEKIMKIGAALNIAKEMFSTYSNFVQAREQKMLAQMEVASDRKKKKLKTQLDSGIITQEAYKRETELIDAELDRKKAELEYKSAKRQRNLQIAQAAAGVAMMVINAAQTNPFFPLGLVMTGVAAALGAAQIATILNTPLPQAPGAEDGFYPVLRSQDNKLFNARRKTSKTGIYNEPTMLVGEAGATMPELVVSGKTMRRIDPDIQRTYMNEIRRVEGFENGLLPSTPASSGSDELLIRALDLIKENTEVMKDLRKYGVKGVFQKSSRLGKDILEMTNEYEDLTTKNIH